MEHPHFEIRVSQDEDTRKVVATDSLSQEEIPIESQAETNVCVRCNELFLSGYTRRVSRGIFRGGIASMAWPLPL